MKIKNLVRKSIILSVALLSINTNISFAHYMSSYEERDFGKAALEVYKKQTNTYEESQYVSELNDIEFKLSCNNSVLTTNYEKGKRYLQSVSLWSDPNINAQSFPGGYTLINKGMWNFVFTDSKKERDWQNLGENHENATKNTMAFVVAHEFGHFANEDYLRKNDAEQNLNLLYSFLGDSTDSAAQLASMTQNFVTKMTHRGNSAKYEHEADEKALEFTENSWDYNAGGGLIFFDRLLKMEDKNGNKKDSYEFPHPLTQNRFDKVCEFIKNQSNGKVIVNSLGNVNINNKEFKSISNHEGISDREQTFQDAGAISKAIKFDVNLIVFARHNKSPYIKIFSTDPTKTDIYVTKYENNDYQNISLLTTINVNHQDFVNFLNDDPKLDNDKKETIRKEFDKVNEMAALISDKKLKWGIPNGNLNYFFENNKIAEKMKK